LCQIKSYTFIYVNNLNHSSISIKLYNNITNFDSFTHSKQKGTRFSKETKEHCVSCTIFSSLHERGDEFIITYILGVPLSLFLSFSFHVCFSITIDVSDKSIIAHWTSFKPFHCHFRVPLRIHR